jgi:hypothetical protein
MRMRKLWHGQFIVLCVPDEVERKIRAAVDLQDGEPIDASHVLEWTISETHADLSKNFPLWAAQGERSARQQKIRARCREEQIFRMNQQEAEEFLEPEAETLESWYRPSTSIDEDTRIFQWNREDLAVSQVMERCEAHGVRARMGPSLRQEQERESLSEKEHERQVQRPEPADPANHPIHPDLVKFVQTGILTLDSPAFMPAFQTLKNTSAVQHVDTAQLPTDLIATLDYMQTIQSDENTGCNDSYQRPTESVLTSHGVGKRTRHLVIISPHEAQELLPKLRTSTCVVLYIYFRRLNPAYPALDGLTLFTVPQLPEGWQLLDDLRLQLNLFPGQLYFNSLQDYRDTCDMLSLSWKSSENDGTVQADSFIKYNVGDTHYRFTTSPAQFLKMILTKIRSDYDTIDGSHWGTVSAGDILTEKVFS